MIYDIEWIICGEMQVEAENEEEAKNEFEDCSASYLIDCEYHDDPKIKTIKLHKINKNFSFNSDLPDTIYLKFDGKVIKEKMLKGE